MEPEQVIDILARTNKKKYNQLKACEELSELTEVLLKKVTKKGGPKEPSDREVIDEIGDAAIRIAVLRLLYGPERVDARINHKLQIFAGYIKDKKYVGKI